ncbi:competence-stimulating peptide ComC [Streptococcus oralis]|nr:competence-stimulating peptide ComC [Streptococcus oralis]
MKNTVKLEQFKEITEAELQEIRGGDWRISETIVILFFQEESNEIKVESNGFIWIRDSYFLFSHH